MARARTTSSSNPTGTLPAEGARQWEHVYESQLARGLPRSRAAASAWATVKKSYRKVGGQWHQRNRGGAKFLSDEIAFEKAMAAIRKANQSLKAMATLTRRAQPSAWGPIAHGPLRKRIETARKAALKHYDVAGEWGRKVANKIMRRKITKAQESFLRGYASFSPSSVRPRIERAHARASQRNGLRSIGRSIVKGAKGMVSRAKKALQDERDDEEVAKVREHALGAGAQINANNHGEAKHELEMARRALGKIHDADKRDRAERQYLAKIERMLRIRNRGHGTAPAASNPVSRNRSKTAARRLASARSQHWGD